MENNIRQARKRAGMTQEQLAEQVGIGVPQISRWESGVVDIPMSKLKAVSDALNVPIADLVSFPVFEAAADRAEGNAVIVPMEGASAERMREDLPIFGTALGAPKMFEGEAVEQTMLNTGEIIQYAKRPTILNGRADAYGLYIQGSSMAPVYLEGELLLAETKRPPRVGDDVVVYLRPPAEEDDGDRARGVLVKRLIRRTASYVELEQFSPAMTFRLAADEVLRTDRILRLTDLLL